MAFQVLRADGSMCLRFLKEGFIKVRRRVSCIIFVLVFTAGLLLQSVSNPVTVLANSRPTDYAYYVDAETLERNTDLSPVVTEGYSAQITDKPSEWAQEDVTAAIAAGLVPQPLQSRFTQATTRAEFCALAVALYETATGSEITDRQTFTDTNDVNVEKAAAIGVVNGVGNNQFSPDSQLTREQAATMLSRLADAIGDPLPKQAATFADKDSVAPWALEAVGQMQATGIMGGVGNNTFAPKSPYTREQSIITVLRLFDIYCAQGEPINPDNEAGTVTIRYNANGGSGEPSSHTVTKDSNGIARFNLSTARPTRSGYNFLGWRLENSTNYDIDSPGQSITIGTNSATNNTTLTYYAQWEPGTP